MNTRNFLAELKRRHVYSEQFHTRARKCSLPSGARIDCVVDCIRFAVPHPTEWQRIGN